MYVPAEWVCKEGGRGHTAQHSTSQHTTAQHTTAKHTQHTTAQQNTAQHSTAHYTTEGTADSGTNGAHAGEVGQTQEDTTRPTEGKEQVQGATGQRPNATTN